VSRGPLCGKRAYINLLVREAADALLSVCSSRHTWTD
jgi:hypothetical protein